MTTELTTNQQHSVSQTVTPMDMLNIAIEKGSDIDKLAQLMELNERWEADKARKAFHQAMTEFKRNPPIVVKDMLNKQYNSHYSSLANLVNTINTSLSEHDLNARWDFDQSETMIKVTCILSHVLGHSESVSLSGPPDTSGSKNAIQQIRSTTTYLKGATFEAVTGIASREGNADDDGNGASDTLPRITEQQAMDLQSLIDEVGADKDKFLAYFKIKELSDLPQQGFKDAVSQLERKRKQ